MILILCVILILINTSTMPRGREAERAFLVYKSSDMHTIRMLYSMFYIITVSMYIVIYEPYTYAYICMYVCVYIYIYILCEGSRRPREYYYHSDSY